MEKIICNSDGCPNPSSIAGLCDKHYARKRQGHSARPLNNDPHPECAVSHCTVEANSRKEGSLCHPHYQKKYRGFDPEEYVLPDDHPYRHKAICAEPNCQKRVRSNDLCDYHRLRARKGKTEAKVRIKMTDPCRFEGCENLSAQGGWCQTHYEQLRVKGEVKPARDYGIYTLGELACPIPNCRKPQKTRGHCSAHSKMLEKYAVTKEQLKHIWTDPRCSNPGCNNTTRLHMDHDHATGEFRALLCNGCNTALGMLKENPERMTGLREYIERFQGGTE